MNWPTIGLLSTFIFVLLCLLAVAMYSIKRLHKHTRKIEMYLDQYKALSNKYVLQLTRIGEIAEEAEQEYGKDLADFNVNQFISNIKSLGEHSPPQAAGHLSRG